MKALDSGSGMRLFSALLAAIAFASSAHAQSYTWNNGNADWTSMSNWNPNGIPGPSDDAIINGGTCTVSTAINVQSVAFTNGTLNGGGTLTIASSFNWSG